MLIARNISFILHLIIASVAAYSQPPDYQPLSDMPPFSLQKATFWRAICGLLEGKKPHIELVNLRCTSPVYMYFRQSRLLQT